VLGSTAALATGSGTLATTDTYEPFGRTETAGTPNPNPFRFTGREDDSTGLYYYRARYYDPTRSRFVSEDPIGFGRGLKSHAYGVSVGKPSAGSSNLYGHAGGNPSTRIDPLGLDWIDGLPTKMGAGTTRASSSALASTSEVPSDTVEASGDWACPAAAAGPGGGTLNQCLDACEAGGRAWENFCRSLKDPRARAACWALQFAGVNACRGWCYWKFTH